MSPRHSDQMSQRPQVSRIVSEGCSAAAGVRIWKCDAQTNKLTGEGDRDATASEKDEYKVYFAIKYKLYKCPDRQFGVSETPTYSTKSCQPHSRNLEGLENLEIFRKYRKLEIQTRFMRSRNARQSGKAVI